MSQNTDTTKKYKMYCKVEYTLLKSGVYNLLEVSDLLHSIGHTGVYIITSKPVLQEEDNIVYYVGFSNALPDRALTSCNTRMRGKHNKFYLHIIDSYNSTDSQILELLLINKYKPVYNKASKYDDTSSFLNIINLEGIKTVQFMYDN